MSLHWTTESPKIAGWYWWRRRGGRYLCVLCVTIDPNGAYWVSYEAALNVPGEWCGPLEVPV